VQQAGVTIDPKAAADRLRRTWMVLPLVGLMGWIDYLTNRQPGIVVVELLLVVGGIAIGPDIARGFGLSAALDRAPRWVRPALLALPAVLWFFFRGQGVSRTGWIVAAVGVGSAAGLAVIGPQLDRKLAGFYAARNRVLPRLVRTILAVALPVVVSLVVVHGSIKALPVLFQGTTESGAAATGRPLNFILGTVISVAGAFLLMREAPDR
jgi:hypothetical protein